MRSPGRPTRRVSVWWSAASAVLALALGGVPAWTDPAGAALLAGLLTLVVCAAGLSMGWGAALATSLAGAAPGLLPILGAAPSPERAAAAASVLAVGVAASLAGSRGRRTVGTSTQPDTKSTAPGPDSSSSRPDTAAAGAFGGIPEPAAVALRESEERYRRLMQVLPSAVFVNTGGRITYCNLAMLRVLGIADPGSVLGRSPFELIHPDFHPLVRMRIARLQATGIPAPDTDRPAAHGPGDARHERAPAGHRVARAPARTARAVRERLHG